MAGTAHKLGKILITIPDGPGWAMWPAIIGQHERAAHQPMRKPIAEQVPGSVGVLVCLAGSAIAEGSGWRRDVAPGRAVVFRNAVDDFQIASLPGKPLWRSLDIYLRGDLALAAAAGLIAERGWVHEIDIHASVWREAISAIPGGYGHARIWSLEQGMAFAARVFAQIQASVNQGQEDGLVSAALDIMRRVGALRSVADVAVRLDVSREHLSRRMSAAGIDAASTFRRIRIERACAMLGNRNQAIAEIARVCGWRSQAAFARAIVEATGRTPRAWRSGARATT